MGTQPFRRISSRSPGRPVSGRKRDFSGGSPSGGSPGVSFLDPSPSPRCANFTGASALSAYPYSTIPHQRLPASVWQIRPRYFHCRGKIPGSIPLRTPALIFLIPFSVNGAGGQHPLRPQLQGLHRSPQWSQNRYFGYCIQMLSGFRNYLLGV